MTSVALSSAFSDGALDSVGLGRVVLAKRSIDGPRRASGENGHCGKHKSDLAKPTRQPRSAQGCHQAPELCDDGHGESPRRPESLPRRRPGHPTREIGRLHARMPTLPKRHAVRAMYIIHWCWYVRAQPVRQLLCTTPGSWAGHSSVGRAGQAAGADTLSKRREVLHASDDVSTWSPADPTSALDGRFVDRAASPCCDVTDCLRARPRGFGAQRARQPVAARRNWGRSTRRLSR